jgi:hypothetical protein
VFELTTNDDKFVATHVATGAQWEVIVPAAKKITDRRGDAPSSRPMARILMFGSNRATRRPCAVSSAFHVQASTADKCARRILDHVLISTGHDDTTCDR